MTEVLAVRDVVVPFVAVLNAPYLSSPFKVAALVSIQEFLRLGVFLDFECTSLSDALTELVENVCRLPTL